MFEKWNSLTLLYRRRAIACLGHLFFWSNEPISLNWDIASLLSLASIWLSQPTFIALLSHKHTTSPEGYWKSHNSKDIAPLYSLCRVQRPLTLVHLHFLKSKSTTIDSAKCNHCYQVSCEVLMFGQKYYIQNKDKNGEMQSGTKFQLTCRQTSSI